MTVCYSYGVYCDLGRDCNLDRKKRSQALDKLAAENDNRMRRHNSVGESPISKTDNVEVPIETEAFAETMVDISDRREPCSPTPLTSTMKRTKLQCTYLVCAQRY